MMQLSHCSEAGLRDIRFLAIVIYDGLYAFCWSRSSEIARIF